MTREVILVTGGAGFIGSNILAEFESAGRADLICCDWFGPAAEGKWRNVAKRDLADIVAPERLFDWLAADGATLSTVVHMGAISSTTEPDADLIVETNFRLSRDLWRWCAEQGVSFVYASSAATYGDGDQGFEDGFGAEDLAKLRPLNAYGWSKLQFDRWVRRAVDQGCAPPSWAGLRFFNVYGPNEDHKGGMRSVVNKIFPDVMAGEPVKLFKSHRHDYEDGGQMRDFVWVGDCARIAVWMTGQPRLSGLFNIGSGQARSFLDLASATFAAAERDANIRYIDMPETLRGAYQYFTEAPIARLRTAGWNAPMTSLEDGVTAYVRDHLMSEDSYR